MDGRELRFLLKSGWVDYIYLEQKKKKKDYMYSRNSYVFARKL